MVKCNRERVKEFDSVFITSDIDASNPCEQNLSNADMLDFRTRMDELSFYEKTDWNKCEDLIYVQNEEALWQTIVGEIKTPKGALRNSIGQASYGCAIWEYMGENLDSLTLSEIEHEVIQTCIKYPEVNNVIGIESYIADRNALLIEVTLDSIYGTFDGSLRIPTALVSKKRWTNTDDYF